MYPIISLATYWVLAILHHVICAYHWVLILLIVRIPRVARDMDYCLLMKGHSKLRTHITSKHLFLLIGIALVLYAHIIHAHISITSSRHMSLPLIPLLPFIIFIL